MRAPLPVRATAFAAPRTFQIEDNRLVVTPIGQPGGSTPAAESIPLRDIIEVRLSHSPARFQFNRFRCTLKTRTGGTHTIHNTYWEGPVSEKILSAEYCDFVIELCPAVMGANPTARFLRGRNRTALIVENGILLVLLALLIGVWIWLRPHLHWFQILNLALILVYAPIAIVSWRKNQSGTFDPHAVPAEILPSRKA